MQKRTSVSLIHASRERLHLVYALYSRQVVKQVRILTHSNKKGHLKVSHFVGGEGEMKIELRLKIIFIHFVSVVSIINIVPIGS